MNRFQKFVTSFFALMVLAGMVLQMGAWFVEPPAPPTRAQIPHQN